MLCVLLYLSLLPVARSQFYQTLSLLRNTLYNCVGECDGEHRSLLDNEDLPDAICNVET